VETKLQADQARSIRYGRGPSPRPVYQQFKRVITSGRAAPTIAIGLVLTLVSWPVTDLVPQAGLDPSWQAGLAMAFLHRLHWGPGIDFTYGPLGFFTVPVLFTRSTAALSLAYLLVSRTLLFALLFRSTQSKFPGFWPIVAAYIVGTSAIFLVDPADLLMGCILLIGLLGLGSVEARIAWLSGAALGAMAGAGLLLKFSVGLLSLWVAVVVVASTPRWKGAAITSAASLPASLLLGWSATGNPLGDLSLYLRLSSDMAGGYAGAMSYEQGRLHEWFYAAIVLACLVLTLWFGLRYSTRRTQLCTALIFLAFTWVAFKEGFVRHDTHDWGFFGLMMIALAGAPWGDIKAARPVHLDKLHRVILTGGLAVVVLIGWRVADAVPASPLDIPHDASGLVSEVKLVLNPDGVIDRARSALETTYAMPRSIIKRLQGHTVAIEPWENTVAWAFGGFRWDPEPVLQQYSAYEASLDDLDASFLESRSAPARMLVQPTEDYFSELLHDPFLGAPSTMVARVCHYAQAYFTTGWQLLVHVPDRCGQLVRIKTVTVNFGQKVAVPPARRGSAVIATFSGVGSSIAYRLENFVLKAPAIELQTPSASYRFIAATAGDLHMLRWPVSVGYTAAFTPPTINSFVLHENNIISDGGRYVVTFYELNIRSVQHDGR
jgi:hypothetical protein